MADWSELTALTRGEDLIVERVRLTRTGIRIEGDFEPPPLAALSAEDQLFVAAFVRSHGSIKEMERLYGVSYPTIKGRLNRVGGRLGFVDVRPAGVAEAVLERLEAGEITADEAVREIKAC